MLYSKSSLMRCQSLRLLILSGLVLTCLPSQALQSNILPVEPCPTAGYGRLVFRRMSIRGGSPDPKEGATDWNDWSFGSGKKMPEKKHESSPPTSRRRKGGRSSAAPLAPPLSIPENVPGAPAQAPDETVPDELVVAGAFLLSFEEDTMVFQMQMPNRVPSSNAALYSAPPDLRKLGIVEDVYGPINSMFFTLKCDVGVLPASFPAGCKAYIAPTSTIPLSQVWANTRQSSTGKAKKRKKRHGRREEEGAPRPTIRYVRAFS